MKKKVLYALICVLVIIVISLFVFFGKKSHSVCPADIILGEWGIFPHLTQKKIDLSESNINIRLTNSERSNYRNIADELALRWFINILILEDYNSYDEPDYNYDIFNRIYKSEINQAWIENKGWNNINWYETLLDDTYCSDEIKEIVSELIECGKTSNFVNDEVLFNKVINTIKNTVPFSEPKSNDYENFSDYWQAYQIYSNYYNRSLFKLFENNIKGELSSENLTENEYNILRVDYQSIKDLLMAKLEEILQDKINELFVSKLKNNLNYSFEFEISNINENEYEKYGIGSNIIDSQVFSGGLSEDSIISTVDFSSSEQYYDYILTEYIDDILSGNITNESFYLLKDGKDIIEHTLTINGGTLHNLNESRVIKGYLRGNNNWPGTNYFLGSTDNIPLTNKIAYGVPGSPISRYFNLQNTCEDNLVDNPSMDFITNMEFDDNGKLISISKPILYKHDIDNLLENNVLNFDKGAGIYRYKLTEKKDFDHNVDNVSYFRDNNEEYIIDFLVKNDSATNESYIVYVLIWNNKDEASSGWTDSATFQDYYYLTRPFFTADYTKFQKNYFTNKILKPKINTKVVVNDKSSEEEIIEINKEDISKIDSIKDEISYENLVKDKNYYIYGRIVKLNSDNITEEVVGEGKTEYLVEEENGLINNIIQIDKEKLNEGDYLVQEYIFESAKENEERYNKDGEGFIISHDSVVSSQRFKVTEKNEEVTPPEEREEDIQKPTEEEPKEEVIEQSKEEVKDANRVDAPKTLDDIFTYVFMFGGSILFIILIVLGIKKSKNSKEGNE